MHRTILSQLLIICSVCTPLFIHARTLPELSRKNGKEAQVRQRITELFLLCRARDYVQSASFLVYRGENRKRAWKDIYNYNNREEQPPVEALCNRIREALLGSEAHEFGAVRVERESEGEWVVIDVTFTRKGERHKLAFAFLKVKGKYCLGDIDNE